MEQRTIWPHSAVGIVVWEKWRSFSGGGRVGGVGNVGSVSKKTVAWGGVGIGDGFLATAAWATRATLAVIAKN